MNNKLINCFQDTLQISTVELSARTRKSINSNRVYKENFVSKATRKEHRMSEEALISVYSGTTLDIAKNFTQYGRVAVLNFANPHNPGGGVVNGAMAQEECLCRSSNLYACISDRNVYDDFYGYHRQMQHYFFSDRLIYTRDVTVFKDDEPVPRLMPEYKWFDVDVITCSAPYLGKRKYTNNKALKELFKGRIKNIFEASADNGADVLILGAFGCGAFKNPSTVVANAFFETIIENEYQKCFKHIVFAIKNTNGDNPFEPCPNILPFESTFFWQLQLKTKIMTSEFGKLRWTDNYLLEQTIGSVELPSGKVLNGGDEFNPYYKWRTDNKYYEKQFSILGDSISTLNGYNPRGYKVFYDDEKCRRADIKNYTDTWWGAVLEFFGADLLVNNSWSGSRVTRYPYIQELFPSGCSDERTSALHINGIKPDVIIINLGTNDWAFGARPGGETRMLDEDPVLWFDEAYEMMLRKIKSNYPESEIWCCTLSETFISENPQFQFPHKYGGFHIKEYNEIIRDIASINGCNLIDLYNMNMPYDSIDGTHPNRNGMKAIAASVCYAMADETGKNFLALDMKKEPIIYEIYLSYKVNASIHNVMFFQNRIIYKNTIYNKRYDIRYPSDFFEKKELVLNRIQENRKDSIVRSLELEETWRDNQGFAPEIPTRNDNFKVWRFDGVYFNIKNPELLIEFCEEVCDFAQYEYEPKMRATTIYLTDNDTGQKIQINETQFDIGRSYDTFIKILDINISRKHATFFYENSFWFIRDNNSTNGTCVNGEKIEPYKNYQLLDNDIIEFAGVSKYIFNNVNAKASTNGEIKKIGQECLVGKMLDNGYKLIEEIDRDVYLAIDSVGNKVVVESFPKIIVDTLRKQVEILNKLEHPHINKIIGLEQDETHFFIIFEYTEGVTLKTMLLNYGGKLRYRNVIIYALQIAETLQYMHSQTPPIINRDIKPHNILVDHNENVKLVDFDIAMEYNPEMSDISILGTIGYAPPEQFIGRSTPRTDIYALGILMHQLVTGVEPQYQNVVLPIRQIDSSLPEGLEYIISKCTMKEPDNRYQSCDELISDLKNHIDLPPKKNVFGMQKLKSIFKSHL